MMGADGFQESKTALVAAIYDLARSSTMCWLACVTLDLLTVQLVFVSRFAKTERVHSFFNIAILSSAPLNVPSPIGADNCWTFQGCFSNTVSISFLIQNCCATVREQELLT
jgi:hypothetical protein